MPRNQSRTETLLHLRTKHVPQEVTSISPLFVARARKTPSLPVT
jgi:hypothetical protein